MARQARVALFKSLGAVMEALPERFDVGARDERSPRRVGRRTKRASANLERNRGHVLRARRRRVDDALLERVRRAGLSRLRPVLGRGREAAGHQASRRLRALRIAEGLEHLYDAKEPGRAPSSRCRTSASWEWGGSYLNSLGLGMTAVAEDLEPPELFAVVQRQARVDRHPHRTAQRARRARCCSDA